MIIIAENKKSHYLIKKFLIESGIEQEHKDVQLGLTPVQDQDPRHYVQTDLTPVGSKKVYTAEEEIEEDSEEFQALTAIEPRYKGLSNLALKGILTLSTVVGLWNGIPDYLKNSSGSQSNKPTPAQVSNEKKVMEDLIQQNPESSDEIEQAFNFTIEYDKSTDKEKVKQSILRHEGFKGLPYPDHHQWSVGHGTKVFSDADLDEGEHERLENDWKKQSKKGVSKADWIEKEIPGWREKFFDTYSIENDNASSTSPVNLQQAGIAADQEVAEVIDQMKKVKYFKVLPQDTKQAFYDMAYNMGPGFLDKFKNFNETMRHAAIVLDSEDLSEEEVEVAINLFEIAAEEILYNFNEDGTIKGKTKYHSDLQKSGRPQENYELIKKGIEEIRISITPRNFQNKNTNESLRKVYSNLFV